jgi:hypothetical protein
LVCNLEAALTARPDTFYHVFSCPRYERFQFCQSRRLIRIVREKFAELSERSSQPCGDGIKRFQQLVAPGQHETARARLQAENVATRLLEPAEHILRVLDPILRAPETSDIPPGGNRHHEKNDERRNESRGDFTFEGKCHGSYPLSMFQDATHQHGKKVLKPGRVREILQVKITQAIRPQSPRNMVVRDESR